MNEYQQFIALSRYARWIDKENRRETWPETVKRYYDYMKTKVTIEDVPWGALEEATVALEVMPSMRALMTAGPALDRCNVAGYNCAYLTVDSPRAFDETMYILMCGTGVGFSVEEQYIKQLPEIAEHFELSDTVIHVRDSKSGWARAFRELLACLWTGQIPSWDTSRVRKAGDRLVTFGGRASGPEPLAGLFSFASALFQRSRGRRLTSIECHDLLCKVGEVVVVGGVRRSAMISLSDVTDERMRNAKSGNWWGDQGQRALANNSAVYHEKPTVSGFMQEWKALYDSRSGERGIFNRASAVSIVESSGRRDPNFAFGTNPCSEIILRPNEFCNLTEVVVRFNDSFDDLAEKVRLATILGTLQSTLIDFKYLRKTWKDNCAEERLLGVSLTGIFDNARLLKNAECWLPGLKKVAQETNEVFADRLGINRSAAITCVKPSGTVSQLVDAASGIHPSFAEFYVRTVRADNKDPLTLFMKDVGFLNEPDITKKDQTTVFSFPQRSPLGSYRREDLGAIQHLEVWKTFQKLWCEHKPSVTINVKEDEWLDVGAWVYKNFDDLSGISFLPYSEHTYKQAPYQEVSKEVYEQILLKTPKNIDWSRLSFFELEDNTTGARELACSGDVCELVDIG